MFDNGNDPKGRQGLDDLDFKMSRLDEMSHALCDLEHTKQGLLEEVRVLRSRLFEEKEDESDVYYFLHKKLDDNFDVICALERQLMVETADREKAETEYIRQIEELNYQRDEELEPLKEKLAALEKQVNSMRDAAESKRECDALRTKLEEELQSTRSKIESDLSLERRRKLQEKQRVRRQVDVQIKELSTDLLWRKEAELANNSARATENNEKLRVALQSKAKQAERMMVRNQGLAFENTSLRNEVELAKASEVVLSKRVQAYHNLVVGLKDRLERQAAVDENERQALADLEESLAEGNTDRLDSASADLNTPSLASDASGTEVAWTSGVCGGVTCGESVDQLHEAIESIRRLHEEFRKKARMTAERVEELEASATTGCRTSSVDPLTERLLETCQRWMTTVQGSPKQISNGIPRGHPCENITQCSATDDGRDLGDGSASRAHSPCATPSQKRSKGVYQPRTWGQEKARASGSRLEESTPYTKPPPGPLATAASTYALRRDLFYALVDALRRHQDGNWAGKNNDGEAKGCGVEGESSDQTEGDPIAPLCGDQRQSEPLESNACSRRFSNGRRASATEVGCRRASTSATSCRTSRNDISSSSSISFFDLTASEVRDASTQTVAKHFPERFPSVPPARRLVVSSTFVTSGGALCSANSSTSRGKGLGTWSRSTLGELHRD